MSRVIPLQLISQGDQVARICNACRYCEHFCAVFPAMARRRTFTAADLTFLAHLCHDCRECLYSCQYAPPHEFGVHVPHLMAAIRRESYARFAWPAFAGGLVRHQWGLLTVATVALPVVALVLTNAIATPEEMASPHVGNGAFYSILPHDLMVGLFGLLGLFVLAALTIGLRTFWRETADTTPHNGEAVATIAGLRDALTLRNLGSDGSGCAYPGEEASTLRRRYHHLTFYGFALCFAATTVAAFYENALGWIAPYPAFSLPVLLGSAGGLGLIAGPVGLLWLKRRVPGEAADRAQAAMDVSFLVLLLMTALTGFLLLALRETVAMGALLAVHLGVVAGLFLSVPYGKFAHGLYRTAALIRDAREARASSAARHR